MTVVHLVWGSFEYTDMQQNHVWSFTRFMAAIGGSIGMWLGLSILSLIQALLPPSLKSFRRQRLISTIT